MTERTRQRERSERVTDAYVRWRGPTEVITREGGLLPSLKCPVFWWFFAHISGKTWFLVVFVLFVILPGFWWFLKRAPHSLVKIPGFFGGF